MRTDSSNLKVSENNGIDCLNLVAKYFGRKNIGLKISDQQQQLSTTLIDLAKKAETVGFRTRIVNLTRENIDKVELPIISKLDGEDFFVIEKRVAEQYFLSSPSSKKSFVLDEAGLLKKSISPALLLRPTPHFYESKGFSTKILNWAFFGRYVFEHKRLLAQLAILMLLGSMFQLIAPFLTQSIVDIGINTGNLNFIQIILIAQLMLFIGSTSVDFLRSWILLHITTRINTSILTDFLIKLMKLPISFFDNRVTGEIMQRMSDQSRIQSFLTGSSVEIIFSVFNFVIFSIVLISYNGIIFLVFILGSIVYLGWILLFLRRRRNLDDQNFEISSASQNSTIELILGMKDIKLNNYQDEKRWHWERIQARLFGLKEEGLKLEQHQHSGAFFVNNIKNILITFLSAKAVVHGELTLGGMMAIQYVIGQMNGPVENILGFIQGFQDAKISLSRLNEIHGLEDEADDDVLSVNLLPESKTITIQNVSYKYPGSQNSNVLNNINLKLLEGKTTAIVGMSGSGKTTLLKMLLRFYKPSVGEIKVDYNKVEDIQHATWRAACGIVMQEGFIFSDTIQKNIAVGDEIIDETKLRNAIKIANIGDFLEGLPNGLDTKIGSEGNGISQGQRQRILIARAVYKDPEYMFFDEATNALDTNNEKTIMDNLRNFFINRTVVIVAHRLSTVYNADHIIVMNNGEVIEQGKHDELIKNKSEYYSLVHNQLELES